MGADENFYYACMVKIWITDSEHISEEFPTLVFGIVVVAAAAAVAAVTAAVVVGVFM